VTADWRARFDAVVGELERFPLAVLQLMFRVGVGGVFWNSGQVKIASWQVTLALFEQEYKVPVLSTELAAQLATAVELTCPVLLVLGLAARLATLPLLTMTFVIQVFVYPEAWSQHLVWASMLLFILTRGPGPISLDRMIARRVAVS
jgi:putative oxidoreductase